MAACRSSWPQSCRSSPHARRRPQRARRPRRRPRTARRRLPAIAQALFIAAMQRVRMNLPEPPDSSALKSYPIYAYLVAARLRRDLTRSPNEEVDSAIDAFLQAHAAEPVTHALRHQWLASLAQRRRWDWFLPRSADVTDPQLICDRLLGRLTTGDTVGLSAEALARWSLSLRQPQECAAVFAWLRSRGLLTPALEEARARAALTADNAPLAREFIAEVPAERAAPLMQWLQLIEAPRPSLESLAMNPKLPVDAEALAAGFTHLSHSNAAAASALLPQLLARPDITPTLEGRLRRAAALGAAYARQPGAVAAFSELSGDSIDATVQEWRVRAALWSGTTTRHSSGWARCPRAACQSTPVALLACPRDGRDLGSRGSRAVVPGNRRHAGLLRVFGRRSAAPTLQLEHSAFPRRGGCRPLLQQSPE